jgi:hypothetical protein
MSTRAVYSFCDKTGDMFHVYKHFDGYPQDAYHFIAKACLLAWPLPRFEASEFAAAFISANKDSEGDICLTDHWNRHGDLQYRYEVTCKNTQLYIYAIEMPEDKLIFEGTLEQFKQFNKEK